MRRSAARARRRKSPTFYVDECLGRFVAASLAQAGVDVRPWYDHFAGSPDLEFLPLVGKNDWVFLTKDKNIRRNQLEVRAILNSGVRAFVVTATDLRREEMAALLLKAIPKCTGSAISGVRSFSTSQKPAWSPRIRAERCGGGREVASRSDSALAARRLPIYRLERAKRCEFTHRATVL